jgi:hypothetical protein
MDLEQTTPYEFAGVMFEHVPVFIVAADVLTVGAAVHEVVPSTGFVVAWRSSHGVDDEEGVSQSEVSRLTRHGVTVGGGP